MVGINFKDKNIMRILYWLFEYGQPRPFIQLKILKQRLKQ